MQDWQLNGVGPEQVRQLAAHPDKTRTSQ